MLALIFSYIVLVLNMAYTYYCITVIVCILKHILKSFFKYKTINMAHFVKKYVNKSPLHTFYSIVKKIL